MGGSEGVSLCILYRVLGTQLDRIFNTLFLVLKVHVHVHCVHVYIVCVDGDNLYYIYSHVHPL